MDIFTLLPHMSVYFINCLLLCIIIYIAYRVYASRKVYLQVEAQANALPPMKKRDFTVQELRTFDGVTLESNGRILVAVNDKVFDVTKSKLFFGEGGPYSVFAGHDASRGLATFSLNHVKEDYDDLSDLTPAQMESIKEWELQFIEKYDFIGKLLKPGEQPFSYSEDEEDYVDDENNTNTADDAFSKMKKEQ